MYVITSIGFKIVLLRCQQLLNFALFLVTY